MLQRTPGRKHGTKRTKHSSGRQQLTTLSLETLESRCLLSITELFSLASDFDTEPSLVADQAAAQTNPLAGTGDTFHADSPTHSRSTSLLLTGQLSDVSNSWQTVSLPESYNSMV
ncbi:MAG: hypothetical protein CMJ81_21150, partial [Planctomycetaceae bacterium]|nr:hypothetical protein [Planctomycetaceae bacterium]